MKATAPRLLVALACLALTALAAAPLAQAAFPAGAKVVRKKDNDRVRFVGTAPGRSLGRPAGFTASSDPRDVGRAFLNANAAAFGLRGASSLRAKRVSGGGRSKAVRYQQLIDGLPVLGGEFNVRLNADNEVLSVLGEADPTPSLDTTPGVARADAERTAIAKVAKDESVSAAKLEVSDTELSIFNDAILGGPGGDQAQLVWAVVVTDGLVVRNRVLVDAENGGVALSLRMNPDAKNRSICDGANNPAGAQVPCTTTVLTEGGTYGGSVADVQPAYNYSGATYDFFFSKFGRDSLDGAGMPLKSTVRYCDPNEDCPFGNAFWNGEQMVYGDTYASADDVVGHELSHGFTEFTSGLYYYYQSGAINESMSDVFGEIIDQQTASPGDATGDRWLMGESLPIGAIRDMEDPGAFGDPDRMLSANYSTGTGDSGGVHTNSGVNNKTAFLMVDGGTFNGQTVAGIGADKTARIYYKVEDEFLTSGSDYGDLGLALGAACDGLVGTNSITAANCTEVRKAVTATQMATDRPETPDQAECTAGQTATYAFNETVEGALPWTNNNQAGGTPAADGGWYLDDTYATSGTKSFFGADPGSVNDRSLTMTQSVVVPAGAFLSFQHVTAFEAPNFDGGVVEYSTDNGVTWADTAVQAIYGTGVIATGSGNPLAGRKGFVGVSGGYRRSVASIASLAGLSIRLRFRIGTDEAVSGGGWQVDDIRIGSCGAAAPQSPLVETGAATNVTSSGATLNGTVNPRGTATTARIEISTTSDFASPTTVGTTQDMGSGSSVVPITANASGLPAGATRYFRVVAIRGATTYPDATPSQFTTTGGGTVDPTVTTQAADGITTSSGVLHGTFNPNGTATTAHFEVADNPSFTGFTSLPDSASFSDGTAHAVSGTLNGLAPSTTRYFRLVAMRGATRYVGATQQFTTLSGGGGGAPTVTTLTPDDITATSFTAHGTVNPNGTATQVRFEIDDDPGFGVDAFVDDVADAGSGNSPVSYDVGYIGAVPQTLYYVRLVAVRGATTYPATAASFTTLAAPEALTGGVSSITSTAATLNGTVKTSEMEVGYHFEYGPTAAFGSTTPEVTLPAGSGIKEVQAPISGLNPSTSYSYRLVISSDAGAAQGSTQTFKTNATTTTTPTTTTPTTTTPTTTIQPAPASIKGTAKALKAGVKSAKVACANLSGKVACKVTFAGAKNKKKVSATLSYNGVAVAKGKVKKASSKGALTIKGSASLPAAAYALTIKVGSKAYKFKVALA